MKNFIGKYIRIIKYNPIEETYCKMVYGKVLDVKVESNNDVLLEGKFFLKNLDKNGRCLSGGYIISEGVYPLTKSIDLYREVTKREYERFKTNLIDEMIDYEKTFFKK